MDNHCSTIISGMTSKKMSILRLGNFEATSSSPMSLFYVRMVSRWRHTKSSWLLQVLFWGNFPEVQTSSSTDLPERISSKRLWCNSWLPLFWWGKCFRRVFRFFPRYGWGNQGERPHCWWSNIQWDQEGGRRGKRHWTIFHNAKTTTRRKDMKPDADSSSSNTSIPDKSRTDMQALEEKVRSKDDYSWQTNKRLEAHAGIVMDLQRLWQGGLFDDYKTTHRVRPFGRNFHFLWLLWQDIFFKNPLAQPQK